MSLATLQSIASALAPDVDRDERELLSLSLRETIDDLIDTAKWNAERLLPNRTQSREQGSVMHLTFGQIKRALGPPMTLPNAPHTRTWSCPLCGVGPDSVLVIDQGRVKCSMSGHSQEGIVAAIRMLLEVGSLLDEMEPF